MKVNVYTIAEDAYGNRYLGIVEPAGTSEIGDPLHCGPKMLNRSEAWHAAVDWVEKNGHTLARDVNGCANT